MKKLFAIAIAGLISTGCSSDTSETAQTKSANPPAGNAAPILGADSVDAAGDAGPSPGGGIGGIVASRTPAPPIPVIGNPVPLEDGAATLTPQNTTIQFVGKHAGEEPNPRTGHFEDFTGTIELHPESRAPQSITVEIQTESLETGIEKLTNHLKAPDFLDAREYPTITFTSTRIDKGVPRVYTVTGDLTLHGVTKEITFPMQLDVLGNGLQVTASFSIDRTEFGIEDHQDQVVNDVSLEITVGKAAESQQSDP